jgi:hypothetical protein
MKNIIETIKSTIANLNLSDLVVSSYGCEYAIGFNSKHETIENFAFNYGATNGTSHAMSDSFSYFLTSRESFIEAITNYVLTKANCGGLFPKGNKGTGIKSTVEQIAAEVFDNIPQENFMGQGYTPKPHAVLDGGAPDWLPETED